MGCLERALSLDGTLDTHSRLIRTLCFFFNCVTFVTGILFTVTEVQSLHGRYQFLGCIFLGMLNSLCSMIFIMLKYKLTTFVIVTESAFYYIALVVMDISWRVEYENAWPMIVLLVDFLLVMQVPTRYSTIVVVCTLVYLVIIAAEETWRFGLLDMPGLAYQEHRRSYLDSMGDCDVLPCKKSGAVNNLAFAAIVFFVDFIVTRGFARGLLKEQASMQRTIATVQDIASLLAGYDVEKVAELLEEHGGELPDGMTTALRKLEQNLRVYKAYLPQTCLPFEDEKDECVEPGSEQDGTGSNDETTVSAATSSMLSPVAATRPSFWLQPLLLSSTNATLLTLNIKDTLHRLEEDSAQFSDLFTTVLLKTLQATDSRRGMVDVFVGDKIHCSFNASKQCASHATSALHAASAIMKAGLAASVNVGVAMGTVLRGDMGCDVMRRFSMVGTLVRNVHGMERAGRMLGCDVVCNRMCFSDAECEHDLRLLPCKVEVAQDCEAQVVAELVSKNEDILEISNATNEWMYQIGGKKHWDLYNTVVRGYLRGESCDTDVAKAWVEAGGSGTPAHAVPSGTCSVVCSYLR